MIVSRTVRSLTLIALIAACNGAAATPTAPPTPTRAPATPTAVPATPTPTAVPATASPTPTAVPATASPTPATAEKCSGQKVTFLLSFFPNIQHIGFLIAANRGYYTEAGLNVEVQPGGPDVNVEAAVGDGSVNMGLVGSFGAVLKARAGGVPLKALAQSYQRMQLLFVATKDSGIKTVADWKGKRIGQIAAGANPERDAMLLAAGLKTTDVTLVQQSFGIDDFLAGKVDVMDGVVYFHPAALQLDGTYKFPDDLNVFYPDDWGAELADQVVVANEDFISANAAAIPCFLRASIKGWTDAYNAWKANDVASVLPDLYAFASKDAFPEAHQRLAFNDVMNIVTPDGMGPADLFKIDPAKMQASYDTLRAVKYLETDLDVSETYDDSFMKAIAP